MTAVDRWVKEIREDWFPDHKAKLEQINENIAVLTWMKPGTVMYYIRFVFDHNKIYITGDVGSAIFELTEKANLSRLAKYGLGYFFRKLSCSTDKYIFDFETAKKDILHYLEESDNPKMKAVADKMINIAGSCSSVEEWNYKVNIESVFNELAEIDCNYWDWIYGVGKVIDPRIIGYHVALKMAYEQLASLERSEANGL